MAFSRRLEIKTLKKMIMIYCQKMHGSGQDELCPKCKKLLNYAEMRVDKCIYGDNKPVCSKCKVHCYKPEMREEIKQIMKYSGPRMIFISPLLSIRYMYRKVFKSNFK
ncbi:MAG: nitrous oxide-stimulated promoter family protein [Syntrophomonas sp.]